MGFNSVSFLVIIIKLKSNLLFGVQEIFSSSILIFFSSIILILFIMIVLECNPLIRYLGSVVE